MDDLAGLVTGQFSVGSSGEPSYQIPLQVPPGTAKMQPGLALLYTGGESDGLLGVGWRLTGLASIRRAGQTPAQDGRWSSIDYSASDRFTLSGERLIAISGPDGGDGTEYRTEIDTWSKIVSHGSAGDGPERFTVIAKSGLVMTFGADRSSRVHAAGRADVRLWALTKVTDRNGNSLSVSYQQDEAAGSYRPARIDYTANPGVTPPLTASRAVVFGYESRPEPVVAYEGGSRISQAHQLRSVTAQSHGETVMEYRLAYREDPVTGRSHLRSVTQADASGASLPAVRFDWIPDAATPLGSPVRAAPVSGLPVTGQHMTIPADLTGDGHTDLVRLWADETTNTLSYAVFLAGRDGYAAPLTGATTCPFFGLSPALTSVDINGDGSMDLVYFYLVDQALRFSTLVWNGKAFDVSPPQDPGLGKLPPGFVPRVVPVDVDGDGRTDLVVPFGSDWQFHYYVLLSNGSTFVTQPAVTSTGLPMPDSYKLVPAQVTGSPQQDLVYAAWNAGQMQIHTLVSTGTGFTPAPAESFPLGSDAFSYILPVDCSGDGLTDIAFAWLEGASYKLRVLVADGTRVRVPAFESEPVVLPGEVGTLIPTALSSGPRTDLLYVSTEQGAAVLTPYIARGGSFVAQPSIATGLRAPASAYTTPDAFGVGRSALAVQTVDGADLVSYLYPPVQPESGRIGTFHTGIGGSISVDYAPLTNVDVYQPSVRRADKAAVGAGQAAVGAGKATVGAVSRVAAASGASVQLGPGAAPPSIGGRVFRHTYAGPPYVIAAYQRNDGRGTSYHHIRTYRDGEISTDGRGWLGFAEIVRTSVEDRAAVTTSYAQAFPLTGRATAIESAWAGGPALRSQSLSYAISHPAASSRVYQVTAARTRTATLPGFAGPGTSFTVERAYDEYGNATLTSYLGDASAGGSPDRYTRQTFANDPATWTIGLLTETADSSDAAGREILRRCRLDYDPVTRQLTSKRVWNSAAEDQSLITAYGYDTVGNRTRVSTNAGSETILSYEPDTDYTFPATRTRAASGSGSLRDSYTYDLGCGRWISHTNPGGMVRTRLLDGLGRVTGCGGPGPDGTPVVLQTDTRVLGQAGGYTHETRRLQSWDGRQWRVSRRTFDGLGRRYLDTRAAAGDDPLPALLSVARRLDSRGRAIATSLPWLPGDPVLWSTTSYDPAGRVIERTRPMGAGREVTRKVIYDGTDRIAIVGQGSPDASVTIERLAYVAGKPVAVRRYDEFGQLTTFAYDPLGRILAATPPGSAPQQVAYDSVGTRLSLSGPGFGTVSFATDYLRRSVTMTFASGRSLTRSHDVLGRLVSTVMDDGSAYEFGYDDASGNAIGRLSSVRHVSPEGILQYTQTFAYDDYGRRISVRLTSGADSYAQGRRFTPAGLTDTVTFPDGSAAKYAFNGVGQPLALDYVAAGTGGAPLRIAAYQAYNAFGRPRLVEQGNGTRTTFRYTPWGAVAAQEVADAAGHPLFGLTTAYSDIGQIASVSDPVSEVTIAAYGYDLGGRLTRAALDGGAAMAFGYDEAGNITALGETRLSYSGSSIGVTPGRGPSYSIQHDPAGNRTTVLGPAERAARYAYNARNELTSVSGAAGTVTFRYDHQGRRLAKTAPLSERLYVTPQYVLESQASRPTTRTKLLHDQLGVTAIIASSGPGRPELLRYLRQDQAGSTVLVTDASGADLQRLRYQPFGAPLDRPASPLPLPAFGGKEYDEETGLYYYAARYYDPEIGRFITSDSQVGGSLLRTGTLNRYSFVVNDPVNLTDPTGHGFWDWLASLVIDIGEIIGGVIAGAFGVESLAGALLGAGTTGAIYDATTWGGGDFSWAAWGGAEAAGAVIGGLGGALGGAAGAAGENAAADGGIELDEGVANADRAAPARDPGEGGEGGGPGNDGGGGPRDDVPAQDRPAPNDNNVHGNHDDGFVDGYEYARNMPYADDSDVEDGPELGRAEPNFNVANNNNDQQLQQMMDFIFGDDDPADIERVQFDEANLAFDAQDPVPPHD